jgi:peptidoglycan/LPS O-acetylase OafA/YrhL
VRGLAIQVRFSARVGVAALLVLCIFAAIAARALGNSVGYIFIGIVGSLMFDALFANPVLRYMGRISYSTYLWHFPIWEITKNPLLTLFLSIAIAEISWRFIESPIMEGKYLPWLSFSRAPHTMEPTEVPLR